MKKTSLRAVQEWDIEHMLNVSQDSYSPKIDEEFFNRSSVVSNIRNIIDINSRKSPFKKDDDEQYSYSSLKAIEYFVCLLQSQEGLYDLFDEQPHKPFFIGKTSEYTQHKIGGISFVNRKLKSGTSSVKDLEILYSSFVSRNSLNELRKEIPNFQYTYFYDWESRQSFIEDLNSVYTLEKYVHDIKVFDKNTYDEFRHVISQIGLALQVAQERFAFNYNNFSLSDIILVRSKKNHTFVYKYGNNYISVETSLIPVMTNFSKSSFIKNGTKYSGSSANSEYMKKYGSVTSKLTDIFGIVQQCYIILNSKFSGNKLLSERFIKIFSFFNNNLFIRLDTDEYLTFTRVRMSDNNIRLLPFEYGETNRSFTDPAGLVIHITPTNDLRYSIKKFSPNKYHGDPVQLFEYLMYKDPNRSFISFIDRLSKCKYADTPNILSAYYMAQAMESYLKGVETQALISRIDKSVLERLKTSIKFVNSFLAKNIDEKIYDDLPDILHKRNPGNVLLYSEYKDTSKEDQGLFSVKKAIEQLISSEKGAYKIGDTLRKEILIKYKDVLDMDNLVLLNNFSNRTLGDVGVRR